ncbi:hypothetical protein OG896_24525 [Streptomyces sp. NBC_00669]|uniref:hypothetical protein n=1 Tax=Streptomyces sp. NBC_00669 TaxID=2976011 RepID=UPI002E35744D|nr:hypothetical protein [Streptomyces sp. NBC_00669]
MSGTSGTLAIPGPAGPAGEPGPAGGPGVRVARASAVTDNGGQAVITWSPPFSAPPVVALAVQVSSSGFRSARITANSASSTTVQADGAAVVELLGISVLAAALPATGVTVHLIATEPQEGEPS